MSTTLLPRAALSVVKAAALANAPHFHRFFTMSVSVAHLLEEALLLPPESRTELVEALLERA